MTLQDAHNPQDAHIFYDYAKNPLSKAKESQVISGKNWRITLITDSLVRLERSENGEFVDAPTQTVVRRNFEVGAQFAAEKSQATEDEASRAFNTKSSNPKYSVKNLENGWIEVETEKLLISYNQQPFSKEGLSIVVRGVPGSQFNTWHYGDECHGNLLGTARTVDEADGAVKLGMGVISRDGWAVLD
ncbi:hypothetical protein HMPREF1574_00869, partial [Gardnerella pickettii JCP7659]